MAKFKQVQVQSQILAPQLRQSLKILQVSALDLRTLIQEEISMNPVLEEINASYTQINESPTNEYDNVQNQANTDIGDANRMHDYILESLKYNETLQSHLLAQIGCINMTEKLKQIVKTVIGSLNEQGFLEFSVEDIAKQTSSDVASVNAAINIVQKLDPMGVGCKDIASSLLVQLRYNGKENTLAFKIIDKYYDALLHNRLSEIANCCSTSTEDVLAAIKNDISCLNTSPGGKYTSIPYQTIIPDVRFYKNGLNKWEVEVNDKYIPKLHIKSYYKDMLAKNINSEDKSYLRLKMRSGRFLIQAIMQRQKTIENISYGIINRQNDFFEYGESNLKPLTLQMLANDLGVHETTISRATANKYADTPFGIFSFKYFFTKGLNSSNGGQISNKIAKQQIKNIIDNEDKHNPLSDQKIVEILNNKGICVARRTVTKYREQLGLLSLNLRRKYD